MVERPEQSARKYNGPHPEPLQRVNEVTSLQSFLVNWIDEREQKNKGYSKLVRAEAGLRWMNELHQHTNANHRHLRHDEQEDAGYCPFPGTLETNRGERPTSYLADP